MTPKITAKRLREYANTYGTDPLYDQARIMEDIGIKTKTGGGYLCPMVAILEAIADSIEQHYVELPTDKDGNQLYINSTVYDKDGDIYHVQGLSSDKFNLMLSKPNEGKELAKLYRSSDFTITKPDSWRRIIEDAIEHGFSDRSECSEPADETAAQLIDRCRKLAGETDE